VEVLDGPGYGQFGDLPTEPEALRHALERKQAKAHQGKVDNGRVVVELWGILEKVNTSPKLRAAVFNALAEEPGIRLDRTAKDLIGRSGYALSYASKKSSLYEAGGIRTEYIFDPDTSAILGQREILADPSLRPWEKNLPAGTVLRAVAFLGAGIVDSTHQRPGQGRRPATASGG
jgi:hypothetical protein